MVNEKILDLFATGLGFGAVGILTFMWIITAVSGSVSVLRINDYGEAGLEILVLIVMLVITFIKFKNTILEYLNG